jgi:WD40 repeat protein
LELWDIQQQKIIHSFSDDNGDNYIGAVTFSPDSQMLVSASSSWDGILLWDIENKTLFASLKEQTKKEYSESIEVVIFSPDGTLLISASD